MSDQHTTTTGPKVEKFRKKQADVFVEAIRVSDRNGAEVEVWCGGESYDVGMAPGQTHHVDVIRASGRKDRANVGDYVVKDSEGFCWVMNPDSLAHFYEPVNRSEQDHPAPSLGRDDGERLEKLADIIGGVHKSCADPELHEDDARFLRDLAKNLGDGGGADSAQLVDATPSSIAAAVEENQPLGDGGQGEAAAEIDRLYKEREEARAGEDEFKAERDAALAALQPFAALAEEVDRLRHSDDSTCPHRLRAGDIRRAASVAECRACGGPPHESWCAASLSTQPVPSYLSEEEVRGKLLGEDAVEAVAKVLHGGPKVGGEHAFDYVDGEDRELTLDGARRVINTLLDAASLSASSGSFGELHLRVSDMESAETDVEGRP